MPCLLLALDGAMGLAALQREQWRGESLRAGERELEEARAVNGRATGASGFKERR